MEQLNQFLPTTILAAILLFLVKELLESSKKRKAKNRKIKAIKAILAEEIERNFWVWKTLRRTLARLQGDLGDQIEFKYRIQYTSAGITKFCSYYEDGTFSGSNSLPKTSTEAFSKNVVEIAELDEKFYQISRKAYDEIAETEHVRSSLINEIEDDGHGHLSGFVDYGIETLDQGLFVIDELYQFCTGTQLKEPKLR